MHKSSDALYGAAATKRRRRWRILLALLVIYGGYSAWRLFPQVGGPLTGTWRVGDATTISFFPGGFGQRGTDQNQRSFRWWISNGVLVMHQDKGSLPANLAVILEYGLRSLVHLSPRDDLSEFDIARLDSQAALLNRHPRPIDQGVVEILTLRR